MISCKPTLWNAVTPLFTRQQLFKCGHLYDTYVLNNMAMITNEQESATVGKVDLHSNQSIGVPWQMVQRDALAKV